MRALITSWPLRIPRTGSMVVTSPPPSEWRQLFHKKILVMMLFLRFMKTYYCHLERIHNCFLHVLRTNAHITRTSNPALHTINAAMNSSSTTKQESTAEIKEGTTYQSGVDLNPSATSSASTEEIPDTVVRPTPTVVDKGNHTFIYFDLETTGLGTSCDIIQLACVAGEDSFNRYVFPKSPITDGATAVTGLYVANGKMYFHKNKVDSFSVEGCLEDFTQWLKQYSNPLLVCHNGRAFDSINLLKTCQNNSFSLPIEGFVDSLFVFREALPDRKCYKLEALVKDCMSMSFKAHSAHEDVKALQSLVLQCKISCDVLLKHSFSVEYVTSSIDYKSKTDECLGSLQPLSNCLSKYMLRKIAQSGLSYQHLKMAYERGGPEGLENTLSETNSDGILRVAKTRSIFSKIINHFSN